MSMSGKLQARIAPHNNSGIPDLSPASGSPAKLRGGDKASEVEFVKLLQNSNADVSRERMAKKSGDLSTAKTDEEFRKMLSEKSNPARTPKNTLGKDDFMKLFIAQMQSQDPMNPQDATQMSAQMAQFNSLEQMMNLNKTLESMLKGQSTDRAVSMVNYIGKEVDLGNGMLKWDKNTLTKSIFEVEQPLANAFVEVRDAGGLVIAQQDLGNLMPGEHNVRWDGKLKDGSPANSGVYNFSLVGKTVEGGDVQIPIKAKVKVTGIDLKTEGGAFFTEIGKIDINDIASVGLQGFEDAKIAKNASVAANTAASDITGQGAEKSTNSQPSGDQTNESGTNQGTVNTMPPIVFAGQDANLEDGALAGVDNEASLTPKIGSLDESEDSVEATSPANQNPLNIPVTMARR